MRAALLILGLVLGLAAAAVGGVRMSHLRHLVPDRLPDWSAPVRDGAGLLRGATDPLPLAGGQMRLEWALAEVDPAGATWRIRAAGPGRRLDGLLTLARDLQQADLTGGTGDIDLSRLTDLPGGLSLGGTLVIDALAGRIDRATARPAALGGSGRWIGARLDGEDLGAGVFELTSGAGNWQIAFALDGPAVTVRGTLKSRFTVDFAALEMTIEDAGGLPADWAQILSLTGAPRDDGTGWRIARRIDLSALGGAF